MDEDVTRLKPQRISSRRGILILLSGQVPFIETRGSIMQGKDTTIDTVTEDSVSVLMLGVALRHAVECMEEMIEYVPEFFRHKWGYQGDINKARETLVGYFDCVDETSTDSESTTKTLTLTLDGKTLTTILLGE